MAALARRVIPVMLLMAGLTAGCTAGAQSKASSPAPSPSSGSASSPAPSPSGTPSVSLTESTDTTTPDSSFPTDTETSPSDENSSSPPGPLPSNASGRTLTLADVFSTEGEWKDDRYDIANRAGLTGIGTVTRACSDDYAAILELRLAGAFNNLQMVAGQANNSSASDEIVVVEILANGKQIDTRRVPFNKLQTFQEPITAVNALQIRVYLDPATCASVAQKEVTAVIQGLTVS